jgi:glycosyltransferase involved in cell wall biosynthesis
MWAFLLRKYNMKVLQVVKTNEGATWAFAQAKWLFENGVQIVTVLPSIHGGMADKYKSNGMEIIEGDFTLPVNKPWEIISRISRIKNCVEKVQPDIIHCHFVTNIMMLRIALRNSNIPRLFQVPGPLHLESRIFRASEIKLSKENDFWAGACKKTCDMYLQSGIPEDKVFLAYYGGYGGITCNEYKNSQNKLHDEFNISSDKKLIGMVSYFYKPKLHLLQKRGLKGHEDFIDAIALIRKKDPLIIGIIIGDAWGDAEKYVQKVKRYAKDKCGDGIIFTGFRNDLKEIYKELDVAVHPSHSENLGGAAESLAAGVPTISTNVGGFIDIVINNKTGYTVNPNNPEMLALAIFETINDLTKSKQMAMAGQRLVRELLDINNTAAKIKNIYTKIIG